MVYKVMFKICNFIYVENTLKNIMEQHLQDVDQQVKYNKYSDTVAAHLTWNFEKLNPQQCREIMIFEIISTLKYISFVNIWGKSSCMLYMKYRLEIIFH